MTCILGVAENGKMYMGGDALVSFGWHMEQLASPKVVRRGPFLIGACGQMRLMNILHYHLDIPAHVFGLPHDEYITKVVVEHIRARCKELGYSNVHENQEKIDRDDILIGYQGAIYFVGGTFDVVRNTSGIAAIGSGYPFALGAYAALSKRMPVERRMRRALEIAADFAYGVDHVINIEIMSEY